VQAQCPMPLNAAQQALLEEVTFQLHQNGNPQACGSFVPKTLPDMMSSTLLGMDLCDDDAKQLSDKYVFEAFLTNTFHYQLIHQSSENEAGTICASEDDEEKAKDGLYGYCDMGPDRSPPQPDQDLLVPTAQGSLPCRFYTREGVRISTLQQLVELLQHKKFQHLEACGKEETCAAATPLDIYAVPAARVFMFAPSYVGEIFKLDHVQDAMGNPLSMEVLSLNPRVFDIFNFFSEDEAQTLIDKALNEKSETHKLHRSTTGATNGAIFSKRTSENAWDTHGKLAQVIKKRCMTALGFDEYYESHTDGLQILRYNLTKAYTPHMDYLDNFDSDPYDYDSSGRGGNRFATILLYMSDLGDDDGGETVFVEAPPSGETELRPAKDVIRELKATTNALDVLTPGSWEETMAANCRSRLAVKPHKSRAVLFYSQLPNGELDNMSKHGGCPVLSGTKWAANLWAWNAPRAEFENAPFKPGRGPSATFNQVVATFRNSGKDARFNDAELFYDETGFFGKLGPGQEVRVNTYRTHIWNIVSKSRGQTLKTYVIEDDSEPELSFEF